MKHLSFYLSMPAVFLAIAGTALAQQAAPTPAPGAASAPARATASTLPQLGARQGDAGRGVPACVTCHGARGEGVAASGFPRLTGQSAAYLVRQIESFANGSRPHAVMTPIAKAMTAEQNRAAALYYSQLPVASGPAAATKAGASAGTTTGTTAGSSASSASNTAASAGTPTTATGSTATRGERLATQGDEALQLQACANCHGPGGAGEASRYPALAGQHASYITAALQAWKTGQRRTDPSGQMPAVAARLNEADVAAVAGYYAALPPTAAPRATPPRQPSAASSATGPGPGVMPAPTGTGTEQGSPLTGGAQGAGGGGATQQPSR